MERDLNATRLEIVPERIPGGRNRQSISCTLILMISALRTYDLCVVGHVTRDRIEMLGGSTVMQAGGTAYYSSLTAHRLGLSTAVVTRMRNADRHELLSEMEAAGIDLKVHACRATTVFVNTFADAGRENRTQKVLSIAAPFEPENLGVDARCYLLGPLTCDEITAECVEKLGSSGARIALDIQGLVRRVVNARVEPHASADALRILKWVDVLKASRDEAFLITERDSIEEAARVLAKAGPSEVLITSGSEGSHIFYEGRLFAIPVYPPRRVVDTNGCGDTYHAAYLAHRLRGESVEKAGQFASTIAGIKTGYHGAFRQPAPKCIVSRSASSNL